MRTKCRGAVQHPRLPLPSPSSHRGSNDRDRRLTAHPLNCVPRVNGVNAEVGGLRINKPSPSLGLVSEDSIGLKSLVIQSHRALRGVAVKSPPHQASGNGARARPRELLKLK